jgi:hypothetical protein
MALQQIEKLFINIIVKKKKNNRRIAPSVLAHQLPT